MPFTHAEMEWHGLHTNSCDRTRNFENNEHCGSKTKHQSEHVTLWMKFMKQVATLLLYLVDQNLIFNVLHELVHKVTGHYLHLGFSI